MLQVIADVPIFETSDRAHTQMLDERIVAFNRALVNAGAWVLAEGLRGSGSAVTVRFEDGSAPTGSQGPFADRDEQLVGFWIIEAQGIDEAVGWARKAPVSSGAIEVRPLIP